MIKLLRPFWNFSIGLMFFSCSGCFSVSDEMNDKLRNKRSNDMTDQPCKGSTNMDLTSLLVFFSPAVFWCLNLTGCCSTLFCLWNLLTNFLQGEVSALLLTCSTEDHQKNYNPIMGFSETTLFSPDLEKLLMNYCDFDDCLEILSWKDFLSVLAAMLTPTCSSWCWWDCALLLSLLLSW